MTKLQMNSKTAIRPLMTRKKASPSPHRREEACAGFGVVDAVRDQNNRLWITYGQAERNVTFAVDELVGRSTTVFRRLSAVGVSLLVTGSQNAFKKQIEHHGEYRAGLVASNPGWVNDDSFVFGDGTIASKKGTTPVTVGFKLDDRFGSRGSLGAWQEGLGSIVSTQPVVAATLAFGLIGPLLRFSPHDITNPILELSGETGRGKTTLAMTAMASWGDDPDSHLGLGMSFNSTVNAIEQRRLRFNDMLMMIDETNLGEKASKGAGEGLAGFAFRMEDGGMRQRFDDEGAASFRVPMIITSNTPLADFLPRSAESDAVRSRIITVALKNGIFDNLPPGFHDEQSAAKALLTVGKANAGSVGHALIDSLITDAALSRPKLERSFAVYLKGIQGLGLGLSSRGQNGLAMLYLAAAVGERAGIFPEQWRVRRSVIKFARRLQSLHAGTSPSPLSRIRQFLVDKKLAEPSNETSRFVDGKNIDQEWGHHFYGLSGERMVAISPAKFREVFGESTEDVMRWLRGAELAKTEGGRQKKLTIKAPASVGNGARVYCLRVDRIMSTTG